MHADGTYLILTYITYRLTHALNLIQGLINLLLLLLDYQFIQNGKGSTKGSRPVQGASPTNNNTNYNIQLQIQIIIIIIYFTS